MKKFEQFISENKVDFKKIEKLKNEINTAIDKIDANMPISDFAIAIAQLIKDEYGVHNYEAFISSLKRTLQK